MKSGTQIQTLFFCFLINIFCGVANADDLQEKKRNLRSRRFEFTYEATIKDQQANSKVRVWLPVPQSSDFQSVKIKSKKLPTKGAFKFDKEYGNKILFVEKITNSGDQLNFKIVYDVTRKEAVPQPDSEKQDFDMATSFLEANQRVPLTGKPVETFDRYLEHKEIDSVRRSLEGGKVMYDFVESHMSYDKSKPGYGKGDAVWACDSRTGNCTDFHSLFISIARANKIPAKFEIGFPLPKERGSGKISGYHCWAQFHTEKNGWVPVDISEADKDPTKKEYYFGRLDENRVHFSTGRDIVLNPSQKGEPLNYFVYPYVEVDGKPFPPEKIQTNFSFKD